MAGLVPVLLNGRMTDEVRKAPLPSRFRSGPVSRLASQSGARRDGRASPLLSREGAFCTKAERA
eukprot:9501656-Pyramimonas_sp.AAC.1